VLRHSAVCLLQHQRHRQASARSDDAVAAIPIAVLSDSIASRLQWAMAPLLQILTDTAARCRQREETGSVLQPTFKGLG
jgi:hypothetical protein